MQPWAVPSVYALFNIHTRHGSKSGSQFCKSKMLCHGNWVKSRIAQMKQKEWTWLNEFISRASDKHVKSISMFFNFQMDSGNSVYARTTKHTRTQTSTNTHTFASSGNEIEFVLMRKNPFDENCNSESSNQRISMNHWAQVCPAEFVSPNWTIFHHPQCSADINLNDDFDWTHFHFLSNPQLFPCMNIFTLPYGFVIGNNLQKYINFFLRYISSFYRSKLHRHNFDFVFYTHNIVDWQNANISESVECSFLYKCVFFLLFPIAWNFIWWFHAQTIWQRISAVN